MFTDTEIREVFHFCFLQRLLSASDPGIYVLKGGVNLRFFFNSPRYSVDMDLDVLAGSVATLKKNGYKILEDAAFQRSLKVFGIDEIEVNDPEKAKHTETTQRFGCSLVTESGLHLPTRVEFSRRAEDPGDHALIESIDSEIALRYRRLAYRCRHYSGAVAVRHKIEALAGRAVTQARDVFDLAILIDGGHFAVAASEGALDGLAMDEAIECLASLHWDEYAGQVVEFLDSAGREEYGTREAWRRLQMNAYSALENSA